MQTCGFFAYWCASVPTVAAVEMPGKLQPDKAEGTEEGGPEWRAGEMEGEVLEARGAAERVSEAQHPSKHSAQSLVDCRISQGSPEKRAQLKIGR